MVIEFRIRAELSLIVLLFLQLCLAGCSGRGVLVDEHQRAMVLVDQGTIQLRRGELEGAQASFEMARQLGGLAQALDGLGCVALVRGDFGLAEEYFLAAYQRDATYDNPLANLALVYDLTGRHQEAEKLYRQALTREPMNIAARGNFYSFISDSLVGREAEARRGFLHAQALGDHPILRENLRRLELRTASPE